MPVTLLGGYLGSGKTTLLNELLANADRRYAVLMNDLGAVNLDAALIAKRGGDMLELTDGCVCCSLVDGFALAFERLRERPDPPDQVLVELSGVADPARVVPFSGTAGFALDGILVSFDLDQGLERERDRWSGDTVQRQIACADLLVLTKRDLVDDAVERAVRDRLAELAPHTPVAVADRGRLPAGWLGWSASPPHNESRPAPASSDRVSSHARHGDHQVFRFEVADSTQREDLERWLLALPDHVVRVKGVVAGPSGPLLVEGVGRRRRVREASHRDASGQDAWGDLSGSGVVGTLVVIATAALDPAELPAPPSP